MTDLAGLDALYAEIPAGDWETVTFHDGLSEIDTPNGLVGQLDAALAEFVVALHNAWPMLRDKLAAAESRLAELRSEVSFAESRREEAEGKVAELEGMREAYWPFVEMIAESRHPTVKDYFDAKELMRVRQVAARAARKQGNG